MSFVCALLSCCCINDNSSGQKKKIVRKLPTAFWPGQQPKERERCGGGCVRLGAEALRVVVAGKRNIFGARKIARAGTLENC
eukprot:scaffold618_cov130-Cylindrotheca_fusiformis.AAC.15